MARKDKIDRYGWLPVGKRGEDRWIRKDLLKLHLIEDGGYQRKPTTARVRDIARAWDWCAAGSLAVARRLWQHNELFIMNGGHRHAASMLRDEITELHCIVVDTESLAEESRLFKLSNTAMRKIEAFLQHNADVKGGDLFAHELDSFVAGYGYEFVSGGGGHRSGRGDQKTIRCVAAMREFYRRDKDALAKVFPLVIDACEGRFIENDVLRAFFYLYTIAGQHQLAEPLWRERIKRHGVSEYSRAIANAKALYGKGIDRVFAVGVVSLLNHKVRNNRLKVPGLEDTDS